MSEDEINFNLIKTIANTSIYEGNNEIKVKYEKISEVPKESIISLNEDTIFRFSCEVKNNLLIIQLSEIGALCPFIYRVSLTLENMIKIHPVFKACDDIQEVKDHINRLFDNKNIWLTKNDKDKEGIILYVRIFNICGPQEIKIEPKKLMTTDKDKILEELYVMQKKDNKIFKDMENSFKKKGLKDALEEFYKIKKNIGI